MTDETMKERANRTKGEQGAQGAQGHVNVRDMKKITLDLYSQGLKFHLLLSSTAQPLLIALHCLIKLSNP